MNSNTTNSGSTYQPARVYDLEIHYLSKEVMDCFKSRTEYPLVDNVGLFYGDGAGIPVCVSPSVNGVKKTVAEELMDLGDDRIQAMDSAGITTALISAGQGIEYLPKEDAVRLAQLTNNQVAEAMKKYPGRILGTITLPTMYVEESVAELERAVKELGLQYWHTHSNYGNEYLFEEKFEPIFAKCAELDVPFYIHPNFSSEPYFQKTGMAMSSAVYAFGADTMRTSMRLILNGIFDKYPNLRMILGHMAEYYPYVLGRIDNRVDIYRSADPTIVCKHPVSYYFKNKNIFMTTSGIFEPEVIAFAMEVIGIDNIVIGTDYPYEETKGAIDFIKSMPISDEDKDKILYKNFEKYILKDRS